MPSVKSVGCQLSRFVVNVAEFDFGVMFAGSKHQMKSVLNATDL